MEKKKLLFLGDSLIEFFDWAARFREHEVYNLGLAGETVEGLASRLSGIFRRIKDTDMVFIMSGINNMAMEDLGFLNTYRDMVREIKKAYPGSEVFVHSLLPVLFQFISNEDIRSVNVSLRELAAEEELKYIDIHSLFLNEDGEPKRSFLLEDGVHISEEGYAIWASVIAKML